MGLIPSIGTLAIPPLCEGDYGTGPNARISSIPRTKDHSQHSLMKTKRDVGLFYSQTLVY